MEATIYTWSYCPFCVKAKQILDSEGITYTEHVMDAEVEELAAVKAKYGHSSVPMVILDGEFIGGCDELQALAQQGKLSKSA